VNKFANVLHAQGVKKGDRVTLYLPMIPEAAYAMLACARIGAVHSIVFGGFSPDSLAQRIESCKSTCIVTADEGLRGGRKVPLKPMSTRPRKGTGRQRDRGQAYRRRHFHAGRSGRLVPRRSRPRVRPLRSG
jgi:acyl-coenzyme A synthetase/AMP-(fatty) acid ligase